MEIIELKKIKVVSKKGHFMPIVFADLPATACGVGVMKLCVQIGTQIKDNKFSTHKNVVIKYLYTPICWDSKMKDKLSLSIRDITY